MRIAYLAAVLALLPAAPSQAWQLLEGRVVQAASGEPLAGATLSVQLAAPLALARLAAPVAAASDAQGRFQIDLPKAMPGIAWDRVEAVMLTVAAPGTRARAERLRRARIGRALEIRLEPQGPSTAAPGEVQARVDALRGNAGATIFVVGNGAQGQAAETRDLVVAEIARALRQHLSTLVLGSPPPEIAVQPLDLNALGIEAGAPLGRLAERLNALMIVAARPELVAPTRSRAAQALVSAVHFGEPLAGLPASIEFDDVTAAEGAAGVAELERAMVPRWTRLALLGWGAREFVAAARAGDVQRLRALQQLVVHELRGSGRTGGDFVAQLQALQRAAEDAIRRSGQR